MKWFFVLLLCAGTVCAQGQASVMHKTYLRAEASPTGKVLATLNEQVELELLSGDTDGWYPALYKTFIGWVHGSDVSRLDRWTKTFDPTVIVTSMRTSFYARPSTKSKVILIAKKGMEFDIENMEPIKGWYHVSLFRGNIKGWLNESDVRIEKHPKP